MEATIRPSTTENLKAAGFWNTSACIVWTAALLVVIVRTLLLSHRGTSFGTYNLAGLHWIHGENVYTQWMGFVYSPISGGVLRGVRLRSFRRLETFFGSF